MQFNLTGVVLCSMHRMREEGGWTFALKQIRCGAVRFLQRSPDEIANLAPLRRKALI